MDDRFRRDGHADRPGHEQRHQHLTGEACVSSMNPLDVKRYVSLNTEQDRADQATPDQGGRDVLRIIRSIGRIGSAARRSRSTNRTSNTIDAPRMAVEMAAPCRDPSRTTSRRLARPPVNRPAPAQSIGATFRFTMGSFTYQASITIAMIANGTLTKENPSPAEARGFRQIPR